MWMNLKRGQTRDIKSMVTVRTKLKTNTRHDVLETNDDNSKCDIVFKIEDKETLHLSKDLGKLKVIEFRGIAQAKSGSQFDETCVREFE